ncbi:sulfite exporter TauE/SafE family protein [Planctomycetota bacterium]
MTSSNLITAIIAGSGLGWVAVVHCYAMCGPLHIAICAINRERALVTLTLYNLGRILGYTLAGVLFGAFGAFINLIPRYCHPTRPTLGSLSLSYLFPAIFMLVVAWMTYRKKGVSSNTANWFLKFFKPTGTAPGLIALGAITALMPCGPLYVSFAAAVTTAHALTGALLMLSFALTQTFFMQLGISVGRMVDVKWGKRFERFFPWVALGFGGIYLYMFFSKLSEA